MGRPHRDVAAVAHASHRSGRLRFGPCHRHSRDRACTIYMRMDADRMPVAHRRRLRRFRAGRLGLCRRGPADRERTFLLGEYRLQLDAVRRRHVGPEGSACGHPRLPALAERERGRAVLKTRPRLRRRSRPCATAHWPKKYKARPLQAA